MAEIKNRFTGEVIKSQDGTNLYRANLREANLYGANLYGANLHEANLRGANLREANLGEANLYGANLREANLYGADLREANLYGANLHGANLREANLRGANLREANLHFCKGLLSFTCEKHLGVYFKHEDIYYFKIGCTTQTSDWWLENFEEVGLKEDYAPESIRLYGEIIKLYSSYELLEKQ